MGIDHRVVTRCGRASQRTLRRSSAGDALDRVFRAWRPTEATASEDLSVTYGFGAFNDSEGRSGAEGAVVDVVQKLKGHFARLAGIDFSSLAAAHDHAEMRSVAADDDDMRSVPSVETDGRLSAAVAGWTETDPRANRSRV